MIRLIFFVFFIFCSTNLYAGVLEVCDFGPGNYLVKKYKKGSFSKETSLSKLNDSCRIHIKNEDKEIYNAIIRNLQKANPSRKKDPFSFTHKIFDKTYLEIVSGNTGYDQPGLEKLKGPSKKVLKIAKKLANSLEYDKNQEVRLVNNVYQSQKKIKINKKKKKIQINAESNSVKSEQLGCDIFNYTNLRLDSPEIEDTNKLLATYYSVNFCRPCPPGFKKDKENKSGVCSIPVFQYIILYQNYINYNIEPVNVRVATMIPNAIEKTDMVFNIGRNKSSDINKEIIQSIDNIHTELFLLPLSLKEQGVFIRQFIDNEKFLFLNIQSYKTTAKLQSIKMSDLFSLFETSSKGYAYGFDVPNYIENFIDDIQKNISSFFATNEKKIDNISTLYSLIPNEDDLVTFLDDIESVKDKGTSFGLRIQSRN